MQTSDIKTGRRVPQLLIYPIGAPGISIADKIEHRLTSLLRREYVETIVIVFT